jgi:hypothetical protein
MVRIDYYGTEQRVWKVQNCQTLVAFFTRSTTTRCSTGRRCRPKYYVLYIGLPINPRITPNNLLRTGTPFALKILGVLRATIPVLLASNEKSTQHNFHKNRFFSGVIF